MVQKNIKKVAKLSVKILSVKGYFCLCPSKNYKVVYVDTNTQA